MCFIIDTDSLINLKRNYSTNVFISLWDNIEEMILNNELFHLKKYKLNYQQKIGIFGQVFTI